MVAQRNKFHLCVQRHREPIVQYVAALRELLVNCEFGALEDDMIRDQIVEKTYTPCTRECLLLETDLTLQKAITIAGQIESVVAEAKAKERTKTAVKGGTNWLTRGCKTLANYTKCPAKQSKCRQCSKVGRIASTYNVQEVFEPELTVLSIEMPLPMREKNCAVSLHSEVGKTVDTKLLVDTGSTVSILPEHLYCQHFSNVSLTVPNVNLVT